MCIFVKYNQPELKKYLLACLPYMGLFRINVDPLTERKTRTNYPLNRVVLKRISFKQDIYIMAYTDKLTHKLINRSSVCNDCRPLLLSHLFSLWFTYWYASCFWFFLLLTKFYVDKVLINMDRHSKPRVIIMGIQDGYTRIAVFLMTIIMKKETEIWSKFWRNMLWH